MGLPLSPQVVGECCMHCNQIIRLLTFQPHWIQYRKLPRFFAWGPDSLSLDNLFRSSTQSFLFFTFSTSALRLSFRWQFINRFPVFDCFRNISDAIQHRIKFFEKMEIHFAQHYFIILVISKYLSELFHVKIR